MHYTDLNCQAFVILDKDGKIASKSFMSMMEPDFKTALDKVSGITEISYSATNASAACTSTCGFSKSKDRGES